MKIKTFEPNYTNSIVCFETSEFTAICPFDGKPDVYHLIIEYTHSGVCVESLSLSEWLLTFRDEKISAENLAGLLAHKLNEKLNPISIEVTLKQAIRSTLQLTVTHKIA